MKTVARISAALAVFAILTAATNPPSETYGDWTVRLLGNSSTIASVSNNAGSAFGAICSQTGCTSFFNPKIECEDGHEYSALVNAPSAAFTVTLECEKLDDLYLYTLPLEGGVADAMSVGGVLGIAFPMQSGEFKVARFSLTGAARASARAQQVAQRTTAPNKQQASDNFSL